MRALDLHWMDNPKWWEYVNGEVRVKDDAPKEAKESYDHYLKQISPMRINAYNNRKIFKHKLFYTFTSQIKKCNFITRNYTF